MEIMKKYLEQKAREMYDCYRSVNGFKPQYLRCIIRWKEDGEKVRDNIGLCKTAMDNKALFHVSGLLGLMDLIRYNEEDFEIVELVEMWSDEDWAKAMKPAIKPSDIDWEAYEEALLADRRNEHLWEMGCGDDERNPHTSNIMFIDEQLGLMKRGDYEAVINMVLTTYDADYFNDYLLD